MHPFAVFAIIILLSAACVSKRSWTYRLVSVYTNTTDKNILEFDMKAQRISRDVMALTGVWHWNFDVDNTTMFELKSYSSYNGIESDYKLLPYQVPKMTFNEFLNQYYTDLFYANFKHCTNLPIFKNEAETPWKKGNYTFDRCIPEVSGIPDVMPDSFYKTIIVVSGQAEAYFILIVKVATQFY